MSTFRLSVIKFGSMDSWISSKGRNPKVRQRHLKTTCSRILPSSVWFSSMNSFCRYHSFSLLPTCAYQFYTKLSLDVILRYFMKELLPLGVVEKPHFLLFLTAWMDKSSDLCMYTITQMCTWSVPHLKAKCWYIDCSKIYYLIEEEDVKKAYEKADSKGVAMAFDYGEEQEEEVQVDINLLLEKKKNKILLQREKEASKAKDKAEKEATKAKDKVAKQPKKGGKASRSKTMAVPNPPILMTETSTTSPSQNPRKWDSSFA